MLLFGSAAMNGFCGAIVGVIRCAVAAAPWKAGSDGGRPVGRIGAAAAGAPVARAINSAAVNPRAARVPLSSTLGKVSSRRYPETQIRYSAAREERVRSATDPAAQRADRSQA